MNAYNKKMREKHKDTDDARIYTSMMFDIVFYVLKHEMNLDDKIIEEFLKNYNDIMQRIRQYGNEDDTTFIQFIHNYVKDVIGNYEVK